MRASEEELLELRLAKPENSGRRLVARALSALGLSVLACIASAQTTTQSAPQQVPPASASIPTGPPPIGPSRKTPPPVPEQDPSKPLEASPSLAQWNTYVAANPIDLDQAIEIGLALNPTLALAGQNVEIYLGRVGEAQSALGPQVGITPGENLIHHSFQPGYGIAATLPIDISHLLTSATEQARFQEIAARLDVNRVRNNTVYTVTTAFFGVLRAQALVKVADTDLQNSLDRLHDSQVRYRAQAVAYIDVLRSQTDVADAQQQLIGARAAVSNAIATLNNAMGVDVSSPTKVTATGAIQNPPGIPPAPPISATPPLPTSQDQIPLPSVPPPSSMPVSDTPESSRESDAIITRETQLGPEYTAALQEALKDRPEIYQAQANIEAAKKGIVIADRSVLPSLAVGIGYFDLRSVTGTRYNEPQGFVGLSIPLYDSGLARSREKEARAVVSEAVTQQRQDVDAVSLDVQQAYLALVQARDQVAVANQALTQAQSAFDLARIRYIVGVSSRAGISPLLEVSDAQVALTNAEQNQVNALYAYNQGRASLDRAIGRFAYFGTKERNPASGK